MKKTKQSRILRNMTLPLVGVINRDEELKDMGENTLIFHVLELDFDDSEVGFLIGVEQSCMEIMRVDSRRVRILTDQEYSAYQSGTLSGVWL